MITLEACIECEYTQSVRQSVENAFTAGAKRVELCRDMSVDGLTPRAAHIKMARSIYGSSPGVLSMIRPRAGDFCYNKRDIDCMCEQIYRAVEAGADGIVLGALKKGQIDEHAMMQLLAVANHCNLSVTFHRAFDEIVNTKQALDWLIEQKVQRVLTCGVPLASTASALESVEKINNTLAQADAQIEVVVGGGINGDTVLALLKQLNRHNTMLSLHSYSGILYQGVSNRDRVIDIIKKIQQFLSSR